jgi:hypothetical protein
MFDYNYIHPGFIFRPCPNMTPDGLRAQYLIPNLMPKCECLSIHSPLPSARATSARDPANPAQTVLLPNGNTLPTAGTSTESFEEIFPCRTGFVTKLDPQISLFSVPIFGVNTTPPPHKSYVNTNLIDEYKVQADSLPAVVHSKKQGQAAPASARPPPTVRSRGSGWVIGLAREIYG